MANVSSAPAGANSEVQAVVQRYTAAVAGKADPIAAAQALAEKLASDGVSEAELAAGAIIMKGAQSDLESLPAAAVFEMTLRKAAPKTDRPQPLSAQGLVDRLVAEDGKLAREIAASRSQGHDSTNVSLSFDEPLAAGALGDLTRLMREALSKSGVTLTGASLSEMKLQDGRTQTSVQLSLTW